MEQGRDFLLEVVGTDYRLTPTTTAAIADPTLGKASSFNNLVEELFQGGADSPAGTRAACVDLEIDFACDSESAAVVLQQQQQQQSVTSMACTLEYTTLQITQMPQVPREGTTQESGPDLPRDILQQQQQQQAAVATFPSLPVFQTHAPAVQLQPMNLLSMSEIEAILSPSESSSSVEAAATIGLQSRKQQQQQASELVDEAQLDGKVRIVQDAINQYYNHGASRCCNGKVQVHEVVLALLAAGHQQGCGMSSTDSVLSFCTKDGKETSEISDHFLARDTKAMGRIWQRVKGNRNCNYDTFARAMRVARERRKDYFDYLESGKGTKKRIYKLGPKGRTELESMRKALRGRDSRH